MKNNAGCTTENQNLKQLLQQLSLEQKLNILEFSSERTFHPDCVKIVVNEIVQELPSSNIPYQLCKTFVFNLPTPRSEGLERILQPLYDRMQTTIPLIDLIKNIRLFISTVPSASPTFTVFVKTTL